MVTSCSYIPSENKTGELTFDSGESEDILSGSKMNIFPTYDSETLKQMQSSDATIGDVCDVVDKGSNPSYRNTR